MSCTGTFRLATGAANATFSVFQATDEEFATIFPNRSDIELVEDLIERVGEETARFVLTPIWRCPVLKRDGLKLPGTLFYDNDIATSHPAVKARSGLVC